MCLIYVSHVSTVCNFMNGLRVCVFLAYLCVFLQCGLCLLEARSMTELNHTASPPVPLPHPLPCSHPPKGSQPITVIN